MEDLVIPADADGATELRARFQLICKRCGSDVVAVNIEPSYSYSEYTHGGGTIQIGCNSCKQNDLYITT